MSETKYLAHKSGLSAGWRGFAIEHELVDGDALVFQLTEPTSFKVSCSPISFSFLCLHHYHAYFRVAK